MVTKTSTKTSHTPIRVAIADDVVKETGDALQGALIDFIDLSLFAKQLHWNVRGRNFRTQHLHLDELVEFARISSDTVAERCIAIGVNPDGRAQTVARETNLEAPHVGFISDVEVAKMVIERLIPVTGRMRERIEATEKEPVTQDMFNGLTGKLEEFSWMWQAEEL